jgi:ribosome-binding protein aMBF1 (putative translation factor)
MDKPARNKASLPPRKKVAPRSAPTRATSKAAAAPPSLQLSLAAGIRRRREALGVSQEAFADEIEMHRTYYGAIERGARNMTLRSLQKVATGLGERVSKLIAEAEKS